MQAEKGFFLTGLISFEVIIVNDMAA